MPQTPQQQGAVEPPHTSKHTDKHINSIAYILGELTILCYRPSAEHRGFENSLFWCPSTDVAMSDTWRYRPGQPVPTQPNPIQPNPTRSQQQSNSTQSTDRFSNRPRRRPTESAGMAARLGNAPVSATQAKGQTAAMWRRHRLRGGYKAEMVKGKGKGTDLLHRYGQHAYQRGAPPPPPQAQTLTPPKCRSIDRS